MSFPTTQTALALTGKRQPLITTTTQVFAPEENEVLINVKWTTSTPLDLHQADGGLLIAAYPRLSHGGGAAGVVVAVGAGDVKGLAVGDAVSTFAWHGGKEANHQEYITVPANLVSKIPQGISLTDAVTVSVNLVTAIHTITKDLELELPWPRPAEWTPPHSQDPILIWGASSSVGFYLIQVLKHWGYSNVLAVASGRHREALLALGAKQVFDYTKPGAVEDINNAAPYIPYIVDCIGSVQGTLKPLTKIAKKDTKVAVMLPVIVQHASSSEAPEYEMDIAKVLPEAWAEGVVRRGVRTHFYTEVRLSTHLQQKGEEEKR